MFDQSPEEQGFESVPAATRLFFAVMPEAGTSREIAHVAETVRARHALTARPYPAERFHVTLHHVGDYPALPYDAAYGAVEAASTVALPSFTVEFNTASSFKGRDRHPLVLRGDEGIVGLLDLQQELGAALQRVGLGKAKPHFTPHLTLLRDQRKVEEQPIEPVSWRVREFVLIQSLLGQSRYVPLGRWTLRDS